MLNRPKPPAAEQLSPAENLARARRVLETELAATRQAEENVTPAHRNFEIERSDRAQARYETALGVARDARNKLAVAEKALKQAEWLASDEYTQRWKEAEALMDDRAKHAADIQRHAQGLHADWIGWHAANRKILDLGLIQDWAGACISDVDTISMFRLELFRAGFKWAASAGFLQASDIKPLTQRVEAANFHALAARKS